MTSYGIDLGTTYSCIAHVDQDGVPRAIPNHGEYTTPSVVYFKSPHSVIIGEEAKDAARHDSGLVAPLIKRQMGKHDVELVFHGTTYTPESVSALILKDLAKAASDERHEEVRNVVITVPAYFGVAQRESTKLAGEIADLNVLSLVPEPVAAAIYYGVLAPGMNKTVLIYDLGGGTFDTTVIQLDDGDVTVVCTDGDHNLGGADWDERVETYLCEAFQAQYPDADVDDEEFLQTVGLKAEGLKQDLSGRKSRTCTLQHGGLTAKIELTREIFEDITAELLNRTMHITERTLGVAARHGVDRPDEVLLVGGSTLMPAVAAALKERFGFTPKMHEPTLAVAKGAAMYALQQSVKVRFADGTNVDADRLASAAQEYGVPPKVVGGLIKQNVTIVVPRAFGVKAVDASYEPDSDADEIDRHYLIAHLLAPNTPLPVKMTEQFYTVGANQHEVHVEIWEQAGVTMSQEPGHNKKIGETTITNLPPLPKGTPIDVTFAMDEKGRLSVHVKDLLVGKSSQTTIELQIGALTPTDVAAARDTVSRLS